MRLHPNHITLLSLFSAILGFFCFFYNPWVSFVLFLVAIGLDAVDGWWARKTDQSSKIGGFIDGLFDRIVEFLFLLSMWFFPGVDFVVSKNLLLFSNLFFGTCMTTFIKSYAIAKKVIKLHDKQVPCMFPRGARVVMFLGAFLLFLFGYALIAEAMLLFSAVLAFLACLQEIIFMLQQ